MGTVDFQALCERWLALTHKTTKTLQANAKKCYPQVHLTLRK